MIHYADDIDDAAFAEPRRCADFRFDTLRAFFARYAADTSLLKSAAAPLKRVSLDTLSSL